MSQFVISKISFIFIDLEDKISRKPIGIMSNRLKERSFFHAVQFGQVGIEHNLLTANEKDSGGNGFNGNRGNRFGMNS